ncbi:MAG: restriction endonuclease subunit S [Fibrobacter sp.]|nr:restriction endonuclease subunit S [Fibrobacter sp.]
MDEKQLKNSILQWAIQGKLVEQNPKDEPAQKLLERIAASRNESSLSLPKGTSSTSLRGAKATKQSKNPPSRIYRENGVWYEQVGTAAPKDISDEIPFEIPESWAWCRFFQVVHIASNLVDSSKYLSFKHIAPDNIEKGSGKLFACKTVAEDKVISNNHLFKKGQIIYSKIRPLLRKCVIAPFEGLCSADMYPLESSVDNSYVMQILLSDMFNKQVAEICASRVKMPKINQEELSRILMPLPPLAEQKRIVAKLEQVLPLAEEYGAAQEQLDKLNKELPEALKKSILQEAIQGKFVPQNPKDEPASVLLAKIRKEKEALVKQGKLKKKDLEITPIDDDEIPFEIPDSWTWCRIGDIFTLQAGKNIASSEIHNSISKQYQYPCYGGNGKRGFVSTYNRKGHYCLIGRQGALCGNINYADGLFYATEHAVVVEVYSNVDVSWSGIFLSALNLNQYATATAQPGLAVANINKVLIPLPPLAEQKRIVRKIEELYKVIDSWH